MTLRYITVNQTKVINFDGGNLPRSSTFDFWPEFPVDRGIGSVTLLATPSGGKAGQKVVMLLIYIFVGIDSFHE